VVPALGGIHALEILAADQKFDIVFCDLMMPEISGMEVYEKVVAEYPELAERFVFMTGGVFTARGHEFMNEFKCQVHEKPIEPKMLIRLVDEAIHGSDEQTALTG